jgi:ankyrin repeat protein
VEASLLSTVKKILSRGEVDVNAIDDRGETPLLLCVASVNTCIAKVFLAKETINLSIQNHRGETPFSLAFKEKKQK